MKGSEQASQQDGACLGQAIEHSDDGLGVEPNADGCVEGVRREHILMHALRPAHRLRDGDQEIVRLPVHW